MFAVTACGGGPKPVAQTTGAASNTSGVQPALTNQIGLRSLQWGFIDKTGTMVIQPQFEDAHQFSEGLAGVKKEGMWGFMDPKGTIVIRPHYDDVTKL